MIRWSAEKMKGQISTHKEMFQHTLLSSLAFPWFLRRTSPDP